MPSLRRPNSFIKQFFVVWPFSCMYKTLRICHNIYMYVGVSIQICFLAHLTLRVIWDFALLVPSRQLLIFQLLLHNYNQPACLIQKNNHRYKICIEIQYVHDNVANLALWWFINIHFDSTCITVLNFSYTTGSHHDCRYM